MQAKLAAPPSASSPVQDMMNMAIMTMCHKMMAQGPSSAPVDTAQREKELECRLEQRIDSKFSELTTTVASTLEKLFAVHSRSQEPATKDDC
jgi:hypothetical protein